MVFSIILSFESCLSLNTKEKIVLFIPEIMNFCMQSVNGGVYARKIKLGEVLSGSFALKIS